MQERGNRLDAIKEPERISGRPSVPSTSITSTDELLQDIQESFLRERERERERKIKTDKQTDRKRKRLMKQGILNCIST